MEKTIEIKRRAQRCILNGDLDGALSEYEKLVASGDSDPYHSVLLGDLLFKKGDHDSAAKRYLEATDGYERVGLVKNAIAVCKKMSRLSLAPGPVLKRLASLHGADGLTTESSLYFMQHAEFLLGLAKPIEAKASLKEAFRVCPDNVRALERLAEVLEEEGASAESSEAWHQAAERHERLGQLTEAKRCVGRAGGDRIATSGRRHETSVAIPAVRTAEVLDPSDPTEVPAAAFEAGAFPPAAEAAVILEPAAAPQESLSAEPAVESVSRAFESGEEDGARSQVADFPAEASSTPMPPGLENRGIEEAASDSSAESPGDGGLPEVSELLGRAQTLFQSGERDAAGVALVRAAQAYDRLERYDNAAAIYRSLSQVTEAPLQVMMLWLKNCQRRDDLGEAARVACEPGDRALIDGDSAGAREWFERARAFNSTSELANRRLERLNSSGGAVAVAAADPIAPPLDPGAEVCDLATKNKDGLIEVSLDRQEPVGMDLGTMIEEFQRGLEQQLDSDPQGHYDIGVSYREMGLFDHAIVSFRTAARAPEFGVRASEMIGRCLLDQGDFEAAAAQMRHTLGLAELAPQAALDIYFQLGLALEAGGRFREALDQFEAIYAAEPNYTDVAAKIRALRQAPEQP